MYMYIMMLDVCSVIVHIYIYIYYIDNMNSNDDQSKAFTIIYNPRCHIIDTLSVVN